MKKRKAVGDLQRVALCCLTAWIGSLLLCGALSWVILREVISYEMGMTLAVAAGGGLLVGGWVGGARTNPRRGYLWGRWAYWIDALADWAEAQAKGRDNPVAGQAAETPDLDRGRLYEQARGTLYLTIAEMRKAYDLLGIRSLDTMMENILDLGLRQTVDAILQKRLSPQEQGLVKETSE